MWLCAKPSYTSLTWCSCTEPPQPNSGSKPISNTSSSRAAGAVDPCRFLVLFCSETLKHFPGFYCVCVCVELFIFSFTVFIFTISSPPPPSQTCWLISLPSSCLLEPPRLKADNDAIPNLVQSPNRSETHDIGWLVHDSFISGSVSLLGGCWGMGPLLLFLPISALAAET